MAVLQAGVVCLCGVALTSEGADLDSGRDSSRRSAGIVTAIAVLGWGLWRLTRPEWIFGLSTDDHARILAAWAIRDSGLSSSDVWAPLPTLVTGVGLLAFPFPHVVPGLVNLGWSGLAVYAVARMAGTKGAVIAAGLYAGSVWFGWLANSALAEPPYVAMMACAGWALRRVESRGAAWLAVLPVALAGMCRYEGWAAVVILPAIVLTLPGSRYHIVGQIGVLLAFPVGWMTYHAVANGDPLGFLRTVLATSATSDPHVSDLARVTADITACAGTLILLWVVSTFFSPPPRPLARALLLLLGVEMATIAAKFFGAAGVHNGPRNHMLLLTALAVGIGAATSRIELGGRRLFVGLTLVVHLSTQLPGAGAAPRAHTVELETVARAAATLLTSAGSIVVDVEDDEEAAFKALIGVPDRVRYARDDPSLAQWREATGQMSARSTPTQILAIPGVLAVITTERHSGATVHTGAGPYVLLTR